MVVVDIVVVLISSVVVVFFTFFFLEQLSAWDRIKINFENFMSFQNYGCKGLSVEFKADAMALHVTQ